MAEHSYPSVDPADTGYMVGALRLVLEKFLQGVDDMLPAQVISFDRDTNRATVQPLIMVVTTENQNVSRAPVASVPVLQLGAGNFVLNFPVNPGDIGWIKANDRDISLFMSSYTQQGPNTFRKHSFSDGVFIPDQMRGWVIADEDESNVVLQTMDGTQRISIWADRVKITSDALVVIDAPLTEFTGAIITGTNEDYDDYAEFAGNIRCRQDVIAGYEVPSGEVSLLTHTHDGVTPGGGDTGEPNGT